MFLKLGIIPYNMSKELGIIEYFKVVSWSILFYWRLKWGFKILHDRVVMAKGSKMSLKKTIFQVPKKNLILYPKCFSISWILCIWITQILYIYKCFTILLDTFKGFLKFKNILQKIPTISFLYFPWTPPKKFVKFQKYNLMNFSY